MMLDTAFPLLLGNSVRGRILAWNRVVGELRTGSNYTYI